MTSILVTDGDERSALATVRSLGRAGYEVHVASHDPLKDLAGRSRFARSATTVTAPGRDRAAFSAEVASLARSLGVEVLLPVTDPSVQAVLESQRELGDLVLPLPSLNSFQLVAGKDRTLDVARTLDVSVPVQLKVDDAGTVPERDVSSIRFPVAIKPAHSVGVADAGRGGLKVTYAEDAQSLQAILASLPSSEYPLLVQERIRGPGMGLFFLLWNGRLLARFAHRRIREKPPSGGVSVLRESIPFDEELGRSTLDLLRELEWQGAAMVEFKVDEETGRPFLMEINGRLWGSLQLAIDSGVDFPRLLVEGALGKEPEPVLSYRVGQKCRWFWGDTDHLLLRLTRSRAALNLPGNAPGRMRTLASYVAAFRPGIRSEVWRWSDPRPFLRETRSWIRGITAPKA